MQANAKGQEAARARRSRGHLWNELGELFGHNCNMSDKVLWSLGLDWQRVKTRFQGHNRPDTIFHAAFCWEWWAIVQYRLSYWVHHHALFNVPGHPFLKRIQDIQQATMLRVCYLTGRIAEALSGARLNPEAEIGPGLVVMHTGSCGIVGGTQIGCNFTIYQDSNVVRGRTDLPAIIGDNVTLFSGARVIGPARIGDGVLVGANAVVTRDLPAGCVALGAPAKPLGDSNAPPVYAASMILRDLLSTLVQQGKLEDQGEGRYLDKETGEVLLVRHEED